MANLAINGGTPVRTEPYPSWPTFDDNDLKTFEEIYRSGVWGTNGSRVPEFEERFAQFQGTKYGVCVNSGTAALYVALKAAGVGLGDEVITTPYTFQATVVSILMANGTPVFVDTLPDGFNIDPSKIEAAITPRTKAVLPVHIAGYPADMDGVLEVAERNNLVVVEDCAQAHGAEWRDRGVGGWGHLGCFSFQSSKNLCAGEGGIVLTNDRKLYERAWSIHNCGRSPSESEFETETFGGNFRLTEWQGGLLLSRLERLDGEVNLRNTNMRSLDAGLGEIPGIKVVPLDSRATRGGCHGYKAIFDPEEFECISRETFIKAMSAEGVPMGHWYTTPMYREPFMESDLLSAKPDYSNVSCAETEKLCKNGLALGQSVLMGTEEDMADIVTAATKIRRYVGELKA